MLHATWFRKRICLYQGEELGLGEAELTFEQLQDPYGITFGLILKAVMVVERLCYGTTMVHMQGFLTQPLVTWLMNINLYRSQIS